MYITLTVHTPLGCNLIYKKMYTLLFGICLFARISYMPRSSGKIYIKYIILVYYFDTVFAEDQLELFYI